MEARIRQAHPAPAIAPTAQLGHAPALVTMGAAIDSRLMMHGAKAGPAVYGRFLYRTRQGSAGWRICRRDFVHQRDTLAPVGRGRWYGMRISLVEKEQASPVVQRIYHALEQRSGSVAPYFRVLAHKPDVLRAFNQLHAAIWADGALAAKLKHLAYLRASILDGCGF